MSSDSTDNVGELGLGVVIPVHNEAETLLSTLPSISNLRIREAIFVLDRCTDSTDKVLERFWEKHKLGDAELVLLRIQKKSDWRIHLNFLYDLGIKKAKSQIILLSQADILHDYATINKNIEIALQGTVSFAVLEHPHIAPWNHFVTKMLQTIGAYFSVQRFSGVIAFCKEHYQTCPLTPEDSLNFDTQMQVNFERKGYPYIYVTTRNLNVRPTLVSLAGRDKLWNVGVDRYKLRKPLWKILLISFLRLVPEVVAGYFHAKLKSRESNSRAPKLRNGED
jgi:glycosyltransferase involved in cell wall biosynthesis